jgi:hypothetical protein
MYTGFKLFGADVRASYFLTKRVFKGYPLSVRERRLLVRMRLLVIMGTELGRS